MMLYEGGLEYEDKTLSFGFSKKEFIDGIIRKLRTQVKVILH
jgi:hypothetical protein